MAASGVDLKRDGIPDVLQQPQVGFGAPVQNGAPVHYAPPVCYAAQAPTMAATGVV